MNANAWKREEAARIKNELHWAALHIGGLTGGNDLSPKDRDDIAIQIEIIQVALSTVARRVRNEAKDMTLNELMGDDHERRAA